MKSTPPRLIDQLCEQYAAKTVAAIRPLDAEGDLRQIVACRSERVHFGRGPNQAVLHIGNNDSAVGQALLRVPRDKALVRDTIEAVMAAFGVQP